MTPPTVTPDPDNWELSPEIAHPAAAASMSEPWYWDGTDHFSPFGNDSGWDALATFREWRPHNPNTSPIWFVDRLLKVWEAPRVKWSDMNTARLLRRLDEDFFFGVHDQVAIAIAFGQLILEGRLHPGLRARALLCLDRQRLPCLLEDCYRDKAPQIRRQFDHMAATLSRPWPP